MHFKIKRTKLKIGVCVNNTPIASIVFSENVYNVEYFFHVAADLKQKQFDNFDRAVEYIEKRFINFIKNVTK